MCMVLVGEEGDIQKISTLRLWDCRATTKMLNKLSNSQNTDKLQKRNKQTQLSV